MTKFLVDTNVLSEFSRTGSPDQRVRNWLDGVPSDSLYVSVLTLAEIRRGIEMLPAGRRRQQLQHWLESDLVASFTDSNVLSVSRAVADRWAVISVQAQQRGIQTSIIDGLVAATALEYGLTVATRNVKDFAGLAVEIFNPWISR